MSTHTTTEVQQALKTLGFDPGQIDGAIGPKSSAAIAKFQESKGLKVNGIPDPMTLRALFPTQADIGPRTIQATAADWFLNFAKSKSVWAAGALVALVVSWLSTRFGLDVPADVQSLVTSLLVIAFAGAIGVIQTWFNNPHVVNRQPPVVQKPAELAK